MVCEQAYRLIEDRGEDQQEDSVNEIDGCDGNVESVRFFIHPWPENADTDEEAGLDDDQCNGLGDAAVLAESDEQ